MIYVLDEGPARRARWIIGCRFAVPEALKGTAKSFEHDAILWERGVARIVDFRQRKIEIRSKWFRVDNTRSRGDFPCLVLARRCGQAPVMPFHSNAVDALASDRLHRTASVRTTTSSALRRSRKSARSRIGSRSGSLRAISSHEPSFRIASATSFRAMARSAGTILEVKA
jgi:hypothetical protein